MQLPAAFRNEEFESKKALILLHDFTYMAMINLIYPKHFDLLP